MKRKTVDNPSASSIIEDSTSADKVPSLKKKKKKKGKFYCPFYLEMGFCILNKDGITLGEC